MLLVLDLYAGTLKILQIATFKRKDKGTHAYSPHRDNRNILHQKVEHHFSLLLLLYTCHKKTEFQNFTMQEHSFFCMAMPQIMPGMFRSLLIWIITENMCWTVGRMSFLLLHSSTYSNTNINLFNQLHLQLYYCRSTIWFSLYIHICWRDGLILCSYHMFYIQLICY